MLLFFLTKDNRFIFFLLNRNASLYKEGSIWIFDIEKTNHSKEKKFISMESFLENISDNEMKKYFLFNLDIGNKIISPKEKN
jgi:hypothetical protein